ncbi:efflux RND transporter periplasmic adaptor subunit [Aliirhizobium cellulosilyticum]
MSVGQRTPLPQSRLAKLLPVLWTSLALIAASVGAWTSWTLYMESPWTRDGTIRAYTITVTPQVSGRLAELAVRSDQFVKKGDLLMVVETNDYAIEVESAEAAVAIAKADLENKQAEAARRVKLNGLAISQETEQSALTAAAVAAATYKQARASLDKANLDLQRTRIYAPVDGYITNLVIQPGDYATAGQRALSLVDSGSFWVDAYFEESLIRKINVGDKAVVKLMAYPSPVNGVVAGIGRGIAVANATPDAVGLPTVNPVFTWVRLAQRIPVRVEFDPSLLSGIRLTAGMTATVSIEM